MLKKSLGSGVCLLAFSLTLGAAWTTTRITYNAGDSEWPAVAASGTKVYLVWSDDSPGNSEIFFRKSNSGGTTWLEPKRLTNNTGYSFVPRAAVSTSKICVVWWDNSPGNFEIYAVYSPL